MSAIGDPQLLKLINQGVVYRMLRAKPGMSRAQLSQFTGLTKSTISLLVKELIEERWLVESEIFSKSSMGRPSTSLFVDAQSRSLIGVEFTRDLVQLVSVSTSGEVQFALQAEHALNDIDAVLALLASLVCDAHDRIQNTGLLLGGIGISFAGVFDENSGSLRSSSDFPWKNEPIVQKARLALKKLGLSDIPFFVHSKYHCCAVGAYEFSEQRADTLMYLDFSQSIQTGIVAGDRICAGFSGTAGDIGHTYIQVDGPVCAVCGRSGCVDSLLSTAAIERQADTSVCAPVVAALLHNLWQAFNPSIFVIGGDSLARWPAMFEAAKQQFLREHSNGTDVPQLAQCKHGELATAVGAAALPHYYRLRPLESPSHAISRALDFNGQRHAPDTLHAHVSWN
jgi:predicted NBD/HSP70 family sugar kinase/DNA-binding XRE family transcriptional regulator